MGLFNPNMNNLKLDNFQCIKSFHEMDNLSKMGEFCKSKVLFL